MVTELWHSYIALGTAPSLPRCLSCLMDLPGPAGAENYFFLNTLGENKNSPVVFLSSWDKTYTEYFPVFSEGS